MYLKPALALSIAVCLSACNGGVDLGDQASNDASVSASSISSNTSSVTDPLNSSDTEARAFFPVTFIPQLVIAHVDCVSDSDTITVDQMSYTNGFIREAFSETSNIDTLRAAESVEQTGSQYIEVCVQTEIDRDYYIETRVFAPSITEDSFYVTVGDSEPIIYDVTRSGTYDLVRSRDTDPLRVSLNAGRNILRFHYRERNTELFQIDFLRLPNPVNVTDISDENANFSADILLCAAATGQDPELIQTLVEQHLPSDQFVLGTLINTNDFNSTAYFEVSGEFDLPTVYCLRDRGPASTNQGFLAARNVVQTTLSPTLILGSSADDRLASPLSDNVVFYGFGGDDSVEWQVGGQFYGGTDQDQVLGMTSGFFDGEGGDNIVRLATAEAVISNAAISNIGLSPQPLTQLELVGFDTTNTGTNTITNANLIWPDDTDAFFSIDASESFTFRNSSPGTGVRSLSVRNEGPGEMFTVTGRSLVEYTIPVDPSAPSEQDQFSTVSLLSRQTVSLSFTAP